MEDEKKEPRQSSTPNKNDQNDNSKEGSESNIQSGNSGVGVMSESSIFSFIDETDVDGDEERNDNVIRKLASRKKRPYRRGGKVQKRKSPSKYRRRAIRKTIIKKHTRRNQNGSIPGLSSRTARSADIPCRYCGHRCCRRAVSIQAGSRSAMLSPLFLGTNNDLGENHMKTDQEKNCEISPEMIIASLQNLSKWTQEASTDSILNHIKMNYPVNQEKGLLEKELKEKLRIAAVAGFVKQVSEDKWELTSALQESKLSTTHVTLFWKIYADTMNPIKFDNRKNVGRSEQKEKRIEFPFLFKH